MKHLSLLLAGTVGLALMPSPAVAGGNDSLRAEIAALQAEVATIEQTIQNSVGPIAETTRDIRADLSYQPISDWAGQFSARPEAARTIAFRQTNFQGDLYEVEHECKPFQGDYRNGIRARIHENDSTRAHIVIGQMRVMPQADALMVRVPLQFRATSQVEGRHRIPCAPWGPWINIGAEGEANPTAVFRLALSSDASGNLRYALDLVGPESVGVELAFRFSFVRVRFTVPMDNLARSLGTGTISMLFDRDGTVQLPDGTQIPYSIASSNPQIGTDVQGVSFSSDIDLSVGSGAAQ